MTHNRSTKRILVVFGNLGLGGVQTKIVSISRYLAKNRNNLMQLHVVLRDKPSFNVEHLLDPTFTAVHYRPSFRIGFIRLPFTLYFLWQVLVISPHVILTFYDLLSSLAVIFSKILFWKHIRVILNEDIFTSFMVTSLIGRIRVALFYPYADCIICPTRAAQLDLIKHFHIPVNKTVVIPNWTFFTYHKADKIFRYDLLYMGRFHKQKNLICLLRAVGELVRHKPSLRVAMVGEGSEKKHILRYIQTHRLNNNVVVQDTSHTISRYLRTTKIFVTFSLYEGMSIAILEAMASGIPVVSKEHPGIDEYLVHGNTGLIARTDKEFIYYIQSLLRSANLRKRLVKNAARDVQLRFSYKPLQRYLNVLNGNNHDI